MNAFLPNIMAPEMLRERVEILHALARCITGGIEYRDREDMPKWIKLLPMTIDAAAGAIAQQSFILTKAQLTSLTRNSPPSEGFVREALEEAAHNQHGTKWIPHLGPLVINDPAYPVLETVKDVDNSVAGAFEIAKWNVARSEQRIYALWVVCRLMREHWRGEELMKDFSADAFQFLYRRKLGFIKDLLLFGGLLGGDASSYAVVKAAEHCIWSKDGSTNWALMSYLQRDGSEPGSYAVSAEKQFKTDINELVELRSHAM